MPSPSAPSRQYRYRTHIVSAYSAMYHYFFHFHFTEKPQFQDDSELSDTESSGPLEVKGTAER